MVTERSYAIRRYFRPSCPCAVCLCIYKWTEEGDRWSPACLGRARSHGSHSHLFLFFQGQLSILQEKIDHLERLLAENNEIISNIRDSVINLSESVEDGPRGSQGNASQGSIHLHSPQLALQADPRDCLFASQSGSQPRDVQVTGSRWSSVACLFPCFQVCLWVCFTPYVSKLWAPALPFAMICLVIIVLVC